MSHPNILLETRVKKHMQDFTRKFCMITARLIWISDILCPYIPIRGFHKHTTSAIMPTLESEPSLCEKIQWQNFTPSGNRTQASPNLWFQVQHYPYSGKVLSLDFFHVVKPLMPMLALLATSSSCENPEWPNAKKVSHIMTHAQ